MSTSELNELVASLNHSAPPSFSACQNLLSFIQHRSIHRPDLVVAAGRVLITHYKSKLSDKLYDLYEKVFIAALETGDDVIANTCLNSLIEKFGENSLRIQRLIGLRMEYVGQLDEANNLYESVLTLDATQVMCHKRSIALSFARGRIEEAITRLTRYTKAFASDEQGWLSLAQAYITQQQHELAAFCYEELILISPENYAYHLALADSLFSHGSFESARAYYAQAIELKPENNLRGLYGLIACISAKPAAAQHGLYAWAMAKLINHYRAFAPHMVDIVQSSLNLNQSNNQSINQTNDADSESSDSKAGLRARIATTQ